MNKWWWWWWQCVTGGDRSWGLGVLTYLKICRRGQSMFWPPKMSHSFIRKCCWITLQVLDDQGCKTCVENGRYGKTNFSGRLHRLSGTGIVECLEIIDVGCNLKQFDGLSCLTMTLVFYDRSTPLVSINQSINHDF